MAISHRICLQLCPLIVSFAVVGCGGAEEAGTPTAPTPVAPRTTLSVASISPTSGWAGGGTQISITGTGFVAGATVTLNGVPATVRSLTPAVIAATTPALPGGGIADVVVTNPNGANGRLERAFTYVVPSPPEATSISLAVGSTEGGASYSISGTGFHDRATVMFGTATSLATLHAGQLFGMVPPHAAPGTVDVTVVNPDGLKSTLGGAFTYVEPAALVFDGDWEGVGTEGEMSIAFSVRDQVLTSFSCRNNDNRGTTVMLALQLPGDVRATNGQFRFTATDGTVAGRMTTPSNVIGTMQVPLCFQEEVSWTAWRKTTASRTAR